MSGEAVKRTGRPLAATRGVVPEIPGCSDAHIERALDLPQGTLKSWRAKGAPPDGVALLQLVQVCPWLLQVADDSYDPKSAALHVFRAAVPIIEEKIMEKNPCAL